jgi:hypothetical protein
MATVRDALLSISIALGVGIVAEILMWWWELTLNAVQISANYFRCGSDEQTGEQSGGVNLRSRRRQLGQNQSSRPPAWRACLISCTLSLSIVKQN